ncbi:hypothetical protein BC832DRAFT_132435 [Gaertneriomyces semiglobifer]|nr:hypothetical protein BC832DRAFT_132435 [Gaertneriomyces semiglobifer]
MKMGCRSLSGLPHLLPRSPPVCVLVMSSGFSDSFLAFGLFVVIGGYDFFGNHAQALLGGGFCILECGMYPDFVLCPCCGYKGERGGWGSFLAKTGRRGRAGKGTKNTCCVGI